MKHKILKKLLLLFLLLLAVGICFPVVFLIVGSLMGPDELNHYLGAVLGKTDGFASCVPAAWGFARLDIPVKKVLFNLYIILMLMPFQVTMLSNYLTLNAMHLMDTQWAVILPAAFSTFPVFIMYHFFRSIPKGIIESAELDGANKFQVFLHIGVPLGSSGIVSALVLSFLDAWNLIEQPLTFLKNKTLWPLSLYLPNISMDNAGLAFVASVITLIPSLLVFMAGQNYLEQGIAASAVKE